MKTAITMLAIIAIAFAIGIVSLESDTDLNNKAIGLDPGGAILKWQQPEQWPTDKWTILIYEPTFNGSA